MRGEGRLSQRRRAPCTSERESLPTTKSAGPFSRSVKRFVKRVQMQGEGRLSQRRRAPCTSERESLPTTKSAGPFSRSGKGSNARRKVSPATQAYSKYAGERMKPDNAAGGPFSRSLLGDLKEVGNRLLKALRRHQPRTHRRLPLHRDK